MTKSVVNLDHTDTVMSLDFGIRTSHPVKATLGNMTPHQPHLTHKSGPCKVVASKTVYMSKYCETSIKIPHQRDIR